MKNWTIHDLHDAVFGIDSRKLTGEKLRDFGVTKALVICGPNIKALGYADELADIIKAAGIEVVIHIKDEGEPTGDMVNKAAAVARAEKIDGIVGIGGGAAMDTAKMTGKVLANDAERAEDLLGGYTALGVGSKKFEPVILLSTTAGTGSEVSWGLMCENMDNFKKTFCIHPGTLAIIDPVYYTTLPREITAACGMDSMAHSLESLCNSVAMPHPLADMYCREGIRATNRSLEKAYHEPDDLGARAEMAYAAMIGGAAITLRKTNLGHSISNQLVDEYHFSHGVAVSIGLIAQVRYNVRHDFESSRQIAPCLDIPCPVDADMVKVGQAIADRIESMAKNIGIKNMKQLGVKPEFVDIMCDQVAADKKWVIVPNPPDFEALRVILHEIYDT